MAKPLNKEYWDKFYVKHNSLKHSRFAEEVYIKYINSKKGDLIDLGCGTGKDLYYFLDHKVSATGVDSSMETPVIKKMDVNQYIKKWPSPYYVYARFFWHAIDRRTQLKILKWTRNYIFIEARTTDDIPILFPDHKRNFVNVGQLCTDLKNAGFQIIKLEEGHGFSKIQKEDPHLVRIIAKK